MRLKHRSPRIAIIGGGISGVSAAQLLREAGFSAELFERAISCGGLIRCTTEQGSLFHRVGGHVFNSKNPHVLSWFWKHFDVASEFTLAKRNAVIYLEGNFVRYPIELHIADLPEDSRNRAIDEVIMLANNEYTSALSQRSLGDFLRNTFGETLYELYFHPYNQKIWRQDLNKISMKWLEGKLPMITPKEIIRKNILSGADDMVHSCFYYPINGGSQFIIERLLDGVSVKENHIRFLDFCSGRWKIHEDHLPYDHVIYTGDIRKLPDMLSANAKKELNIDSHDLQSVSALRSGSTTTLLCECDDNPYSWIYLPSPEIAFHRIIMTGNFSTSNSSALLGRRRTTCTVEYSGYIDESEAIRQLNNLPLNIRPIAYNYCDLSYIQHDQDSLDTCTVLKEKMEARRLFCLGRFGEWKYYNMDAAIESAMDVVTKIAADIHKYSE